MDGLRQNCPTTLYDYLQTPDIDSWEILDTLYPAEKDAIVEAVCIFMDNVAKVHFRNAERLIVNRTITSEYYSMRRRLGWEIKDIGKAGRRTLVKQLNELVSFCFRDIEINMISADVKYIEDSLFKTKNIADRPGMYFRRNRKTLVDMVMRAIYMRYNRIPYDFQNKE